LNRAITWIKPNPVCIQFNKFPLDLSKFSKLEDINLIDNEIAFLTDAEINDIDTLNSRVNNKLQIYLHGNVIQCNCQTLKFFDKLMEESEFVWDKNKFWCRFSRLLSVKSTIWSKSKPFRNSAFLSYCKPWPYKKWLFERHVTLDNNGNYSCVYIDGSRKTTSYVYQNTHLLTVECASKFYLDKSNGNLLNFFSINWWKKVNLFGTKIKFDVAFQGYYQ
jgi:hypothetical protein